jgi:hypothetical protein
MDQRPDVARAYGCHLVHLSVDQLHPFVGCDDAGLAHPLELLDGEPPPLRLDVDGVFDLVFHLDRGAHLLLLGTSPLHDRHATKGPDKRTE